MTYCANNKSARRARGFLQSQSVSARLLISIGANSARALINFATGLLIARALNPAGYGDLTFLLGSFTALRSLLDMGASNAFYTFISRAPQARSVFVIYLTWIVAQFTMTIAAVASMPSSILEQIWLGHSREVIALAFLAAFMQQQVWPSVGQIGEARRSTFRVQLLNLCVALAYLVCIALMFFFADISVGGVLTVIALLYLSASILAISVFLQPISLMKTEDQANAVSVIRQYVDYCSPLVVLSAATFLYDFLDKWMLQRFGGASQQGYFQISYQLSAVSLLATISILNVFWKEIAEAWKREDYKRAEMLYKRIGHGLIVAGTVLSGLLIPWSEFIITLALGNAYASAAPVLAIMLIYPIYQSMCQIAATMMLATGQTGRYTTVSLAMMAVSVPLTYFLLAPVGGPAWGGLALGATGLALKLVIVSAIGGNVQVWVVTRNAGWRWDWWHQLIMIPLTLTFGYLAKTVTEFSGIRAVDATHVAAIFFGSSLLYVFLILAALWHMPFLLGLSKVELRGILRRGAHASRY